MLAPDIVPEAKPPIPFVSSHSREVAAAKSVQIVESNEIIFKSEVCNSPELDRKLCAIEIPVTLASIPRRLRPFLVNLEIQSFRLVQHTLERELFGRTRSQAFAFRIDLVTFK